VAEILTKKAEATSIIMLLVPKSAMKKNNFEYLQGSF
jgi:hypothetical protein